MGDRPEPEVDEDGRPQLAVGVHLPEGVPRGVVDREHGEQEGERAHAAVEPVEHGAAGVSGAAPEKQEETVLMDLRRLSFKFILWSCPGPGIGGSPDPTILARGLLSSEDEMQLGN